MREDEFTEVTPDDDTQFRLISDPSGTPASTRGGTWGELVKAAGDTMTGTLRLVSNQFGLAVEFRQDAAPADGREWKLRPWHDTGRGVLDILAAFDAGGTKSIPLRFDDLGAITSHIQGVAGPVDFSRATEVTVPDATAAGQAIAYDQAGATFRSDLQVIDPSDARFRLVAGPDADGYIIFQDDTGVRAQMRQRTTGDVWWYADDGSVAFILQASGGVSMVNAARVIVPAAADGDTNTAAQTTAHDSLGRRAVNGAEIGDTGWRDISGDLLNLWSGNVYLRRVGSLVEMTFGGLDGQAASASSFYNLVPGWRSNPSSSNPSGTDNRINGALHSAASGFPTGEHGVWTAGTSSTDMRGSQTAPMYGRLQWMTQDTWPTTLPGIPA